MVPVSGDMSKKVVSRKNKQRLDFNVTYKFVLT